MVADRRGPEVETVSVPCRVSEAGVASAPLRGNSLRLESRLGRRAFLMEDRGAGLGLCVCVVSGNARDVWVGQRRPSDRATGVDKNHAEPAKKWGKRLM